MALTYNVTTGIGNSVALSMFDANNSGQVATVVSTHLSQTFTTGQCTTFQYSLPNPGANGPVLPQTWVFSPYLVVPGPGFQPSSCAYLYSVTLSNGQSSSFTISISVTR